MGQHLNREGGVTHFNDLGVYSYLYKIARMDDLRDMYQDQVGRIATYDRRKGTDLLDTLETYLECAGNLEDEPLTPQASDEDDDELLLTGQIWTDD